MNFENLISSLIGGLVVEICNIFFVRRDRVHANQVEELKNKLEKHLEEDNPRQVESELTRMRGDLRRLSDTCERLREQQAEENKEICHTLGELSGAIAGIKTWLSNADAAIQKHITDGSIHHGK